MFTTQGGNEEQDDVNSKQKLECLATFSLFGNVMSMKAVRLPGALKDALLLGFSDAKVHSMKTNVITLTVFINDIISKRWSKYSTSQIMLLGFFLQIHMFSIETNR